MARDERAIAIFPIDFCRPRRTFLPGVGLTAVPPKSRRHAPGFSRASLRNLRALSGMRRAAEVLAWWRIERGIDQLALRPSGSSGRGIPFQPMQPGGKNRRNVR